MDQIKFRAWDKDAELWRYFTLKDAIAGRMLAFRGCISNVCRSTDLRDKNGKEIYEGDIVRDPLGGVASVQFNSEVAQFGERHPTMDLWRQIGLDVEVIGNIYESAELLTV